MIRKVVHFQPDANLNAIRITPFQFLGMQQIRLQVFRSHSATLVRSRIDEASRQGRMLGETVGLKSECNCSLNELLCGLTRAVWAELCMRVVITAGKGGSSWH